MIKNETKLNQPLKAGKQFFQHDFYMKTDSITTQNALDENSLGFWRDFYASNHVKVTRTPETCSKICFLTFLSYLSGIWKEFTNGWIVFEKSGGENFSVVSDFAGIGSWALLEMVILEVSYAPHCSNRLRGGLFYLRKRSRATNRAMKRFERVNQGLDG